MNGVIEEEGYVKQPLGFENEVFTDHVFKLNKALYGLKQAPRAWYDRLKKFLIEKGFIIGVADTTLFIQKNEKGLLLIQIYVDDIIFGSTNEELCDEFSKIMQQEFEMSMMGELNYFLGFQVKQLKEGIFIYQEKYVKELLKRFGMESSKEAKTLMSTNTKLDHDENGISIDQKMYRGIIGSLLY